MSFVSFAELQRLAKHHEKSAKTNFAKALVEREKADHAKLMRDSILLTLDAISGITENTYGDGI